MTKKRILLVDDHALFREGLKAIIDRDARFEVVGQAGTAREGFSMAEQLAPDIAVVDVSLPDKSGIELTRQIRARLRSAVIIVSMHSRIECIAESFQAGALGYVVKDSATERLLQGLKVVTRGEYFLDSAISQEIVKKLVQTPAKESRITDAAYSSLTQREQEIMRLLVDEHTVKEVAEQLCISPKTVENHRTNIMHKLEVHSTLELVRYAARLGLIDIERWKY